MYIFTFFVAVLAFLSSVDAFQALIFVGCQSISQPSGFRRRSSHISAQQIRKKIKKLEDITFDGGTFDEDDNKFLGIVESQVVLENIDDEDDAYEMEAFVVGDSEAGERLDKFLGDRVPEQSRTYFGGLCGEGHVLVDGVAQKKSHKVSGGENIQVRFATTPDMLVEPEDLPLDVLFEDDEIIAVSKAPGMVIHPAPGHWSGTFVNALLHRLQQEGGSSDLRPGIVHRLDKGTSGVLLAAKNPTMQAKLSQLFQDRAVSKLYVAVCAGNPGGGESLTIDVPIGRHPNHRQRMVAVPMNEKMTGARLRRALTHAEAVAFDGKLSVVALRIETGRTHQIRVHMQHLRTPVLGDDVYGSRDWNRRLQQKHGITRPLLHAQKLSFKHPTTGVQLTIEAPLPADTAAIVRQIYPRVGTEHPTWVKEALQPADKTSVISSVFYQGLDAAAGSLDVIGPAEEDWFENETAELEF